MSSRVAVTRLIVMTAAVVACSSTTGMSARPRVRTYRMGFSDLPPVPVERVAVATLELWTRRADAAILHLDVPWTALLAGASADSLVRLNQSGLVSYYRAHAMTVVVEVDVTNGLDRSREAPALDSAGRSITELPIQRIYRTYVASVVHLLAPDVLGLASEVNLIQAAAPAPVYAAVVQMTNAAAADVHGVAPTTPLYASMQVEVAWGRLAGPGGHYVGIGRQLTDFPFMTRLALSSYPYLAGFTDPAQIPIDYYSRLDSGRTLPEMVVEGGWASASTSSFVSSPALQAAYIARQAQLLDSAHAAMVFQLEFADIDLASFPPQPAGSILPLFVTLGLVDTVLAPKPALAVWDSTFARPLHQ